MALRSDPKVVAESLYDFFKSKFEVVRPFDDVLYWTDHDGVHRYGLCGPSETLFDAFGGFEGHWDNSRGRLDIAVASACCMPRQETDAIVAADGLSRARSLPLDRSHYLAIVRKWIRRSLATDGVEFHLMPDVKHRQDGLIAFSGRRARFVASGDRIADQLPFHQSILSLHLQGHADRAFAIRTEDPPLFAVAPISGVLDGMREARAMPPCRIDLGFDIPLDDDVYAVLDPWLVQSRYDPPQPTEPGPWPVTMWSEPVTMESLPSIRELVRSQRRGSISAADVPWLYTAGVPRPRGIHPEWQSLYAIVGKIRRLRSASHPAFISGFCNAFLAMSAVRVVLSRPNRIRETESVLKAAGWRGLIVEFSSSEPSTRRRVAAEIERRFSGAPFSEPLPPTSAVSTVQRTNKPYTPLPWKRSEFGV